MCTLCAFILHQRLLSSSAPSPPSPPRTPPPSPPPPSPPPPSTPSALTPAVVGAIAAVGVVLLGAGAVVVFLIVRSHRNARDDVEKRGVRRFTAKELELSTEAYSRPLRGGSFGEVFWGQLPGGEEVAVKKVHQGQARVDDDATFRNEIKLLSSVHHRNLVALHGYCLHKKRLTLVYEYVSRGSLRGILDTAPQSLAWLDRLKVGIGAALGLDYLHSQIEPPIIHSDVKSDNILIADDNEAKVSDFGASVVQEGGNTQTKATHGTPAYMSPEFFESGVASTESDVFSFGMVLLELATDLRPMADNQHILQLVVHETKDGTVLPALAPSLVQEFKNGLGERTQEIVEKGKRLFQLGLKCCSTEPSGRPKMYRVAKMLEEISDGKGTMDTLEESQPGVPFPEYDRPERKVTATQMLDISFTMDVGTGGTTGSSGGAPALREAGKAVGRVLGISRAGPGASRP